MSIVSLNMNALIRVEAGKIKVMIGSSCNDIRLTDSFTIQNDQYVTSNTRAFYAIVCIK
jgi:beta-glucosidase